MGIFDIFGFNRKKTVLIIQCRLSSTRLPQKALLPLGGKKVIDWVLQSMKKVKADRYYLATDVDSAQQLEPYAKKWNYEFFAGSKDDVLDRFCKVIELSKADVVIRATADNPFLFYDAVNELNEEYTKRASSQKIDYITFTGLPHGSGVEIFDAHSLLMARDKTDDPYDHEHVGPSLYNHKEDFESLFLKAPKKYYYPELRTTIDTPADYRRAQAIVKVLSGVNVDLNPVSEPYTTENIIYACKDSSVANPLLLIPSTDKGHGTGHLRRCLELSINTGADIYIPDDKTLEQSDQLLEEAVTLGLQKYQIVNTLDYVDQYNLVLFDKFYTDDELISKIGAKCNIASMDEGNNNSDKIDYLLDIIPSIGLSRKSNIYDPGFIKMPQKVRSTAEKTAVIHNAIVTLGGEDPSGLAVPAAKALASLSIYVTLILTGKKSENVLQNFSEEQQKYIKINDCIPNLKEELYKYDLVVTHYGFTAFEASSAGCAVILLGTSPLHEQLSKKYGFICLTPSEINETEVAELLKNPAKLLSENAKFENKSLSEYVLRLSQGRSIVCPVCQRKTQDKDILVARTAYRTYRRCRICGMQYMSWFIQSKQTEYNREYFYEDYQKQYGKTYEEDFASIKAQGVRRISIIDMLTHHHSIQITQSVFDIGCALGPFLDAANDSGWQVFGTDISKDAVNYVQTQLNYPAVCSAFPDFDSIKEFGVEQFDAVTMWYVIEHFQNVDEILKKVSTLVKKGGIFAFSTPSASGISARYNTQSFYENSPNDHFTLWEIKKTNNILKKYGFKVVKIVPTGIHPERLPIVIKKKWTDKNIQYKLLEKYCKTKKLGDTFEVYCRKIK